MLKISGLDALSRQFEEAEEALKNINGEIGVASFISDDPASIEAAIQHINALVDERAGKYIDNPIIAPLIEGLKEKYRENIIERAAAARLKDDQNNE